MCGPYIYIYPLGLLPLHIYPVCVSHICTNLVTVTVILLLILPLTLCSTSPDQSHHCVLMHIRRP